MKYLRAKCPNHRKNLRKKLLLKRKKRFPIYGTTSKSKMMAPDVANIAKKPMEKAQVQPPLKNI